MHKGDVFMQSLWTPASHGWRGDHRETRLHCIKQLVRG